MVADPHVRESQFFRVARGPLDRGAARDAAVLREVTADLHGGTLASFMHNSHTSGHASTMVPVSHYLVLNGNDTLYVGSALMMYFAALRGVR